MAAVTKVLNIVIILGFLLVDFLLFHDFLKQGETFTFVEYLVGALSIPVILMAMHSLFGNVGDSE